MPGSSRKRAVFVVAAVVCCSVLVAVCFAAFIGQPFPSIANHERDSSLTPRFAAAPKMQLAVHLDAARPVAAAASRAPGRLSRVAAEEAQLRHIEADLVRVSGLKSRGKSAVMASASSLVAASSLAAASSASSSERVLSQSQLDAEVKKFSKNKEVVAKGLSEALQTMAKLRQEEAELHKELGQVLGKITTMKIITSMNIAVPDGMGGDQMQVTITRPVGGKATAKIVKGEGSAAAESSASAHDAFLLKQQPPFASHETALGNDGLGGSQAPLAQEAVLQPLAGSKISNGMVAKVNGDDGLGGRIHPAASAVSNAEPKKGAFRLSDNRMDGIGGSGKHLFRSRSNRHSTKAVAMRKVRHNDGVGGDVRYREARNLKKVPRNRIHAWARDCGDGVGGKAVWCDRVFSAAAGAKGSSSSASAVRATIKAALTAHDAAAKERAGFVSRHRRAGAGAGSGSGSGSAISGDDGLGDDDDEDENGNFGGGFSNFEGGSGGDGNFAGGYDSDGSDGSFSDDTSMDNSEGDSEQPAAQGAAADAGGGPAPAASGSSAKAATTQGGSKTRRRASRSRSAKHNTKGGSQEEQGSSGDSGSVADFQDQQGSSSDSGSVADFQDQPQAQDTTSQDQPSTGSDQSDSSASSST